MDKALRYQRATARDFDRALNLLYKLRKKRSLTRDIDTGARAENFVAGRKQPIGVSGLPGNDRARTIGCKEVDG